MNTQKQTNSVRRVAIFGFANVLLMDIAGPAQVFESANKMLGWRAYEIETVTENGADFVTDTSLTMRTNASFETLKLVDDLIVPGGPGVDSLLSDALLRNFLIQIEPTTERIISICSGSLLTASAGLLNGHQATTHWERTEQAYESFPDVDWHLDNIFTQDGKFHCSAGVTTGIDLALSLVEKDHGRRVALGVAREMVVFMQRHGGQSQYSEPLKAQATSSKRLSSLYSSIEASPSASWSVREMAQFAGTTERTLYRDFIHEFNQSPSSFVEERRLTIARNYLEQSRKSIKEIANLSGFRTEQKMRRCFVKLLGILPTEYRERFGDNDNKKY